MDPVLAEDVPDAGWKEVFQGQNENRRIVSPTHEDTPALRRTAVLDVLAMTGGHRYGVGHHSEHKLRTVLWDWFGDELGAEELDGVNRVSKD